MTSYGYTRVPGSDQLRTKAIGAGPAAELEALDPAAPTGRVVAGEWLARCVVRERYVPVLLEVYDRLCLDQEAHEQAAYGHLYRLALADERNWCRVALKELQQRTRLSERRLNKALAGLVAKGHIRLVERDRRGTLYRVMLPHEIFHEPDGDAVHMTRPAQSAYTPAARPPGPGEPPAPRSLPVDAAEMAAKAARPKARARPTGVDSDRVLDSSTIGALALSFVERFGERRGRTRAEVVEEILGRLEEGLTLARVADELAAFGAKAPRATPVSDLARFVERQPRKTSRER